MEKSNQFDMNPLFMSLHREYGLRLEISYYGVRLTNSAGSVVYEDGNFQAKDYKGSDGKAVLNRRILNLFEWILVNAPTPECNDFARYLDEQRKQLH